MTTKKVYEKLFKIMDDNKDIIKIDFDYLKRQADLHLFELELLNKYGLKIPDYISVSKDYFAIGEFMFIAVYGGTHRRRIARPDNMDIPNDGEYLLGISFPTGPYIFKLLNAEYPEDFFNKFWEDLKGYNPDFIDSCNSSLYWRIENAKSIYDNFKLIYEKYKKLNIEDAKKREIRRLKQKISDLESND